MEVLFVYAAMANMACTVLAIPTGVVAILMLYHRGARPVGVAALIVGALGVVALWLFRVLLAQAQPMDFGVNTVLGMLDSLWASSFACFALPTLLAGLLVLRRKIWPEPMGRRE